MAIRFSNDQSLAVKRIDNWSESLSRFEPELSMGGLAGTGKTTLLKYCWNSFLQERNAVVIAPSNKAVQILKQKGIPAITFHRLIYYFKGWVENEDKTQDMIFVDRGTWGGIEEKPSIIVCDEASMVSKRMANDLRKRGVHILWVGDHGQLPPVGGDPRIMENPDIRLEKIHRQAEGNFIIELAYQVRKSGFLPPIPKNPYVEVFRGSLSKAVEKFIEEGYTQGLVSKNQTRHQLNHLIRERKGCTEILEEGDRLIATNNHYEEEVFNGQIYRVVGTPRVTGQEFECWKAILQEELISGWSQPKEFNVQDQSLGNPQYSGLDKIDYLLEMDYGQAITVHRSQGSQWDRVMIVAERIYSIDPKRMLYTAVTRAQNNLAILQN